MAVIDDITLALNPTVYYTLTEGSGATIIDSAASPDNGAIVGALDTAVGMLSGERAWQFNGASGNYIKVTASPKIAAIPHNSPFTISAWICVDGNTFQENMLLGIVSLDNGPESDLYQLSLLQFGIKYGYRWNWGAAGLPVYQPDRYSTRVLQIGRWHHLVVTVSAGGVTRLYIDGEQRTVNTGSPFDHDGWPVNLYIGTHAVNSSVGDVLVGRVARVAIFQAELSAAQVQSITSAAGLTMGWPANTKRLWRSPLMISTHLDITQFAGGQGGNGSELLSLFAPTEPTIDVDQWAQEAVAAGASTLSMNTKHQAGFCLWNTATTSHKLANTPWAIAGGQTDLLADFVVACRRNGLLPGIYFSLRDLHYGTLGAATPTATVEDYWFNLVKPQITELLGGTYGLIDNIVMDVAPDLDTSTIIDPDLGRAWKRTGGGGEGIYHLTRRWAKMVSPQTDVLLNGGWWTLTDTDIVGFESKEPLTVFSASVTGSLTLYDAVTQDNTGAAGFIAETAAGGIVKVVGISGVFSATDVIRKDVGNYATPTVAVSFGAPAYSWRTSLAAANAIYEGGIWFWNPSFPAVSPQAYKNMLDWVTARRFTLRWNLAPDNSGRIPADQLLPLQTYPVTNQLTIAKAAVQAASWVGETHLGVSSTAKVGNQIIRNGA
jgi:hypothetical protein